MVSWVLMAFRKQVFFDHLRGITMYAPPFLECPPRAVCLTHMRGHCPVIPDLSTQALASLAMPLQSPVPACSLP